MVAHLGFIQDDTPYVIPFTYHYDDAMPDSIYLHGSIRSRALKHLSTGASVCITVTLTDGLGLFSKGDESLCKLSQRYTLRKRQGSDRRRRESLTCSTRWFRDIFLDVLVGRRLQCRRHHPDLGYHRARRGQAIKEWNAKARRGMPTGPDDDRPHALGSAGGN